MSRLYIKPPWPTPWPDQHRFLLDKDQQHYLKNVLRKHAGDVIELFDGEGNTTTGQLIQQQKNIAIHAQALISHEPSHSPSIHLGLAIAKNTSMEFSIQKSVELGTNEITPLICDFSNFKHTQDNTEKKHRRWQTLIIQSCQQCQQNHLPKLNPITPLTDWLNTTAAPIKWVLHPYGNSAIKSSYPSEQISQIVLATGPEGGFSETEMTYFKQADFECLSFGRHILRAETASIVGLTLLQHRYGDFKYKNSR